MVRVTILLYGSTTRLRILYIRHTDIDIITIIIMAQHVGETYRQPTWAGVIIVTKCTGWRRGVAVECQIRDREVAGSGLGRALRRKNSGQVSHTYVSP